MCVKLVHSRRSSRDNDSFTPNATINTRGRTSYQVHEAYSSSKISINSSFVVTIPDIFVLVRSGPHACQVSLERLCVISFRLATPPGCQGNHIPEGNLVLLIIYTIGLSLWQPVRWKLN